MPNTGQATAAADKDEKGGVMSRTLSNSHYNELNSVQNAPTTTTPSTLTASTLSPSRHGVSISLMEHSSQSVGGIGSSGGSVGGGGGGGEKLIKNLKNLNEIIKDEFKQLRHAYEDDIDEQDDNDFHNKLEEKTVAADSQTVVIERQGGLANKFVLLLLLLWYLFSALTLYTNKYIVSSRKADATITGKLYIQVEIIKKYI
jgi:hypothetical protein